MASMHSAMPMATKLISQARSLVMSGNFSAGKVLLDDVITSLSKDQCREAEATKILAEALNERGHVLYKLVDFPEAAASFSAAIELLPTYDVPYYNRGTVKYRMGCFAEAVVDFQRAVNLNPSNEEFRTGLEDAARLLKSSSSC